MTLGLVDILILLNIRCYSSFCNLPPFVKYVVFDLFIELGKWVNKYLLKHKKSIFLLLNLIYFNDILIF